MKVPERVPLVVGNWKMHLDPERASALVGALLRRLDPMGPAEVAVAPSFPLLHEVGDLLRGTRVGLAAQNLHPADQGAFTGEVSGGQLAPFRVRYVIVGHSERRHLFGESDALVRDKVAAARRHGIVPILCVGEREEERDRGETLRVVEGQLTTALAGSEADQEIVIAYEPVWAIGTGRNATPEQIDEVHRSIRSWLVARDGEAASRRVRLLYGGSVTPDNARAIQALEEVDGSLVGGASLDADRFSAIVRSAA